MMSSIRHGSMSQPSPFLPMSRRDFILKTAVAATAVPALAATAATGSKPLPAGAVVLFQGDSITDAGRNRDRANLPNDPAGLAEGYAGRIARKLLAKHPDWKCYNHGISGNRSIDLLTRWERDSLDLEPDVVSILIGVNDTWHRHIGGTSIPVPRYEALYRMVLDDTRERRPDCRLVLCQPFALPGGAFKDEWMPELRERMAVVRRLAADYGATFVPFQEMFEREMQKRPAAELAGDGVHPTELGHDLMAAAWLEATGL